MSRSAVASTGAAAGIAAGIALADGAITALGFGIALTVVLLWAARALVPSDERRTAMRLAAFAFAIHAAAVVVLHAGSVVIGRQGFITGDDHGYAYIALCLERYLRGEPLPFCVPTFWGGSAYLLGTWVYLEALLFAIFGPDVLMPKLVNAAFAAATALLVYDSARRLFGRAAALAGGLVFAVFPSVIVWTALNLKDGMAIFLIALALWVLLRFQLSGSAWALVLAFVVLLPLESVRRYVYSGLVLLIPIVVALRPALPRRGIWIGVTLVMSAALLTSAEVGFALGPGLLAAAEGSRGAMGVGARTSFVRTPAPEAAPLGVGDTFIAPRPTGAPHVVYVAPNTRIVLIDSQRPQKTEAPPPAESGAPDVALVYWGDIVVVGPPGTTPASSPRPLPSTGLEEFRGPPTTEREESLVVRTVAYLPRGLVYAIFAPTPWMVEKAADLLTLPDMALWYVVLTSAVATCWRERQRWRFWAPFALFVLGLLFLFALVEGNVGTLYRHRAMVIPATIVLASPTLVILAARARALRARA